MRNDLAIPGIIVIILGLMIAIQVPNSEWAAYIYEGSPYLWLAPLYTVVGLLIGAIGALILYKAKE